jgi:hypothetical protein
MRDIFFEIYFFVFFYCVVWVSSFLMDLTLGKEVVNTMSNLSNSEVAES